MEMPSLNHTERAVTTHERKGSLAFEKRKRKSLLREIYKTKQPGEKGWKSIWAKSIKAHNSGSFQAHADKLGVRRRRQGPQNRALLMHLEG